MAQPDLQETETRSPRLPSWVTKGVPVLVSILILVYYFHGQDWEELKKAMERADLLLAVVAVAVPQLAFWGFEVLIMDRHVRWFYGPFDTRAYFWMRGAIYILQLLNTPLGGGGALIYIQRKTGMSWRRLLGIALFRGGLSMWGVGVVMIPATLALHYYGDFDKLGVNVYAWWGLLIFGVLYLAEAWMVWHHNWNIGLSKLVVRDRGTEFWTAFRVATKAQWWWTWAMALPPFFFMLVGFYFLAVAYNIHVPFIHFMVIGGLFMLVMDLPIAFAGFGTATMAWKLFFPDQGAAADVAAMTLFLPFFRAACRALIGLASLKPALRDIAGLMAETESAQDREQ